MHTEKEIYYQLIIFLYKDLLKTIILQIHNLNFQSSGVHPKLLDIEVTQINQMSGHSVIFNYNFFLQIFFEYFF